MQYFSQALLAWYKKNGRKSLPWQQRKTPYRVWVSEIMLQQTQVATVIPYYQRFMKSFPSIHALATAHNDDVMAHWAGLGYYSRARNLHASAKIIVEQHNGRFPSTLADAVALPGIGQSTAGAILAFSKGQRHPILDGNVKRVLTRFHAINGVPTKADVIKQLWKVAEQHTPQNNVSDYTQAIMDLGATVCTRSKPTCQHCPVAKKCNAHLTGRTHELPTKKPKKTIPIKQQYFLVLMLNKKILLEKRPDCGIWGSLWCLPELNSNDDEEISLFCQQRFGVSIHSIEAGQAFKHTFSHYQLHARPIIVNAAKQHTIACDSSRLIWYHDDLDKALGLPAPISNYLKLL